MLEKERGLIFFILLMLITAATVNGQTDLDRALKAINEKALRAHIGFLSDDLLGGRAPGSVGSVLAQRYITSQMHLIGLQPGIKNTSYYQKFEVVEINLDSEMHLKISGKNGSLPKKKNTRDVSRSIYLGLRLKAFKATPISAIERSW